MRDLPGQLSLAELSELFEGETALTHRLAGLGDPLGQARRVARELSEEEQLEALNAHPAIGARGKLSKHSSAEQGPDVDPAVIAELLRLNREYEERFGFRFVVFVDRRPKAAILDVLRERIRRPRSEELATGVEQLAAIAEDRWRRS